MHTWRTSAASPRPSGISSTTSTTSTRHCPGRSSGTSSASRPASRSPAEIAASGEAERRACVLQVVRSYREAMRAFAGQRNIEVWYARLDADRFEGELKEKHDKKDA